jgi:hypothetical protein
MVLILMHFEVVKDGKRDHWNSSVNRISGSSLSWLIPMWVSYWTRRWVPLLGNGLSCWDLTWEEILS